MSSPNIRIKRSAIAGKVPHYPDSLALGEFAINTADGKVFIAAGVGAGVTVREVGISTETILSGISTITTLEATSLTVDNTIVGISSGANKVDTATDSGNQWHHVGFLDNRTGYQKIKTNGLTYNPNTGKLYAGIGSFGKVSGEATVSQLNVTGVTTATTVNADTFVGNLTGDVTGIATGSTRVYVDESEDDNTEYNIVFSDRDPDDYGDRYHTLQVDHTGLTFNPGTNLLKCYRIGASYLYGPTIVEQGELRVYETLRVRADNEEFIIETASGSNRFTVDTDTGNVWTMGTLIVNGAATLAGGASVTGDLDVSGTITGNSFSGDGSGLTNLQVGAATSIASGVTTATQGQTSFSTPHAHNDGSTQLTVEAYINGIRQRKDTDFSVSSTSTVTLTSGATVGDEVALQVHYGHTLEQESFTATQGQTVFTISGDYTASKNFKVFLNGVKLRKTTDYSSGASVVLGTGCKVGDEVDICGDQSEDHFTATQGQTAFVPTDANINTKNAQVFLNGVLLRASDWTFGSVSITLTNGTTAGDEIDVVVRRN